MLIYILDMFGTAVFAASGVLLAGRLRMDPFGVVVLASVTAIGGGTIRDMALVATPVFWITDTSYLWVIFITCFLAMLAVRRPKRMPWYFLPVADAIGLAVFVAIGVKKALRFGDFTLASGKQAKFYLDCREITLDSQGALLVGEGMLEQMLGDMPPLGYCMVCEADDYRKMIEFMTPRAGAAP